MTEQADETFYVYDIENRLIEVQTPDDFVTFEYNSDGIRVESTINGEVTSYLIDNNQEYAQVIEEQADDGTTLAYYVRGKDLISQIRGGNTAYYHHDALGSTRALSDQDQEITDSYTYDAYGNLIQTSGTTINPYLFAGEQFDPTIDAYYLRSRYYSPSSGRYLTRDSCELSPFDPVEHDRYTYARNNPNLFTDPSGCSTMAETCVLQKEIAVEIIPGAMAVAYALNCVFYCVASALASAIGSDMNVPTMFSACKCGRDVCEVFCYLRPARGKGSICPAKTQTFIARGKGCPAACDAAQAEARGSSPEGCHTGHCQQKCNGRPFNTRRK